MSATPPLPPPNEDGNYTLANGGQIVWATRVGKWIAFWPNKVALTDGEDDQTSYFDTPDEPNRIIWEEYPEPQYSPERSARRVEAAQAWVNGILEPQGLALFDIGGRFEIERDDESGRFKNDSDALLWLLNGAGGGSDIERACLLALYLDGRRTDDDRFFWPGEDFPDPDL